MQARHQADENHLREEMDKQLPYRVKESSEYLNLKKMEEHMARQKMLSFLYLDIRKRIRFSRGYCSWRNRRRKRGLMLEILKSILLPIH